MNEGGIESIGLGASAEVAENVAEADEKFRARQAAAQAAMAKVQKDEKKAKIDDKALAVLIQKLTREELEFVIFAIDHQVPSLTILAMLSLAYDEAGKVCYEAFHQYIESKADFSMVSFGDPNIEERISLWWTFIVAANYVSTVLKLKDLVGQTTVTNQLSHYLGQFLLAYLRAQNHSEFDQKALEEILSHYQKELFA